MWVRKTINNLLFAERNALAGLYGHTRSDRYFGALPCTACWGFRLMLYTNFISTNDELRHHTHSVAHNCPHLCSLVSCSFWPRWLTLFAGFFCLPLSQWFSLPPSLLCDFQSLHDLWWWICWILDSQFMITILLLFITYINTFSSMILLGCWHFYALCIIWVIINMNKQMNYLPELSIVAFEQ